MEELATKKNLQTARQNLTLAQKGHDLLEIKYTTLLRELKIKEKAAEKIREELDALSATARRARVVAEMETGEETVHEILQNANSPAAKPPYKLFETCAALDEVFLAWGQILSLQEKLAEAEEKIALLNARLTRTKKRVSALGNVVIPKYETRIKSISGKIEENERDEMVRRKIACPVKT